MPSLHYSRRRRRQGFVNNAARLLPLVLLLAVAAGCAVQPAGDGPPRSGSSVPPELPPDPVPKREPKSRYGNGPIYEVHGRPYRVMQSSYGYRERGVASWYGRKFHGRLTSNQEPYDMHALTAAHKTLPLPTWAEVRNLKNGKSVIVRINDRGPFVDNRLIDLSFAAARRLDMVEDGTSLVEVRAISFDEAPAAGGAAAPAESPAATSPADDEGSGNRVYVQVGAFGERANAERRFRALESGGIERAFVRRDERGELRLYRVRIGPITDVDHYDAVIAHLETLGISESHLVTE